MRTSTLFAMAAAGGARLAAAHATVFAIWVNGEDQGLGNTADGYIRSPPNNNPVMDVTSTDMTCNVNGAKAAGKFASVAGGDKITIEWHHNNRDASDDIIADSHKGPIMTYLAPAESNGEGDVWLKIQEEGYSGGKWAVDNLIANKGKYDITLPNLAAGQYLLRSEVLALHEGNRQGGAQWYMECIQLEVTSSGSVTLPAGVAIPGAYKADDAGVLFDIYNSFTSYPIPGPALWDGASSGGSTPAPASSAAPVASSAAPVASSAAPATSATPNATPAPATSAAPAASSAAPAPQQPSAKPTTLATVVKPSASCTKSGSKPTPSAGTGNGSTATVQKYGQCGGKNYSGSTSCAEGWTCKAWNDYYSQCVQA